MKWLITGGCGFLGTSLIKHLAAEGQHAIRVVDNLSVGTREDLAAAGEFLEVGRHEIPALSETLSMGTSSLLQLIVGDIGDEDLALKASEGVDVIVHLAANTGVAPSVENPRMDCVSNVLGTLNYLEGARHNHVKRFVFASSGAPVGECTPPIHEEMVPHPVSPYGASKLAGEGYCSAYFRTFGVETVALRFGNVYGPGSGHKNSVVAKFIKQAINREVLEIYGDGSQTRDFIYIDDLIRAVVCASKCHRIGGEVFKIASNRETTLKELTIYLIRAITKSGVDEPNVIYSEQRLGDVLRNYSDTTKAYRYLGWKSEVTLDVGLEKTISWYINNRQ